MFLTLGNNRPQILVQLEDSVLHAIIAISKGESSEVAIDGLHSQIESLEEDLRNDSEALNWFNLAKPSTPLAGD